MAPVKKTNDSLFFEVFVSVLAIDEIVAKFPQALASRHTDRAQGAWAVVKPEAIVEVVKFIKNSLNFKLFVSMDAVDRLHLAPELQTPRFEVLYFFRSIERNEHLRIKVQVEEDAEIPTISKIFQGANWAERFVWDFYGVRFTGGEQRRMLMYDEFVGHALRKDYPLRGRQGLIPERPIQDIFRGPGTNGVQD
jgi:NADH-quinone oxidoreductase subunit C